MPVWDRIRSGSYKKGQSTIKKDGTRWVRRGDERAGRYRSLRDARLGVNKIRPRPKAAARSVDPTMLVRSRPGGAYRSSDGHRAKKVGSKWRLSKGGVDIGTFGSLREAQVAASCPPDPEELRARLRGPGPGVFGLTIQQDRIVDGLAHAEPGAAADYKSWLKKLRKARTVDVQAALTRWKGAVQRSTKVGEKLRAEAKARSADLELQIRAAR